MVEQYLMTSSKEEKVGKHFKMIERNLKSFLKKEKIFFIWAENRETIKMIERYVNELRKRGEIGGNI